ncbi:MAG: DUF1444 family protein [Bacteroidia bacterium]|nr:DUF1444 family protein [Bacteroidia bacterium]
MNTPKLFLLTIFLLSSSCLFAQKKMSEKAYTKYYLEVLQKAHPSVSFEQVDKLEIIGKTKEGKESKHFLDNSYSEYKSEPDSLDSIVARFVASSKLLFIDQEGINPENIVPIIKTQEYLDYVLGFSQGQAKRKSIVYETYNDDLYIFYAEDMGSSISYFGEEAFIKLGISRDTLLQLAVNNLNRLLPSINRQGAEGRYMLTAGGDYEVSLILMSYLWTEENLPVDGEYVIAIPNRDLLFITGSNNTEFIEELKKISQNSHESASYPISRHLYKWDGERFRRMQD